METYSSLLIPTGEGVGGVTFFHSLPLQIVSLYIQEGGLCDQCLITYRASNSAKTFSVLMIVVKIKEMLLGEHGMGNCTLFSRDISLSPPCLTAL